MDEDKVPNVNNSYETCVDNKGETLVDEEMVPMQIVIPKLV